MRHVKKDRKGRPYLSPVFYQDEDLAGDVGNIQTGALQMGKTPPDWTQYLVVAGGTVAALMAIAIIKNQFVKRKKGRK